MGLALVELELAAHEVQAQDVVAVPPPTLDGVALHGAGALAGGQCQEVPVHTFRISTHHVYHAMAAVCLADLRPDW